MVEIPFVKAQALGNDFVIIQQHKGSPHLTSDQLVKLANRRLGIGCDQIVFFEKIDDSHANISFYNSDGSEAMACGNGTRALACYLIESLGCRSPLYLKTHNAELSAQKDAEGQIQVCFPNPRVIDRADLNQLPHTRTQLYPYIMADIGNPHLICVVDNLAIIPVEEQGRILENHPLFREKGVNVSFVQILDRKTMDLAVWERGAGFTGACGTAACATALVGKYLGLIDDDAVVRQQGGDVQICLLKDGLTLTGKASVVYSGVYPI